MSNYIEYKDRIAFHPGYYIKEIIEELGLSQDDFAKRLGTTPKTLSVIINGGQRLSPDIANKLSKMLGTSIEYWLNLQAIFDAAVAEMKADEELEHERSILKTLGYSYFRNHFGLPNLPRQIDEQVAQVRRFLQVGSLTVLEKTDLAVSFRSTPVEKDISTVVKSNAMLQIAINEALEVDAPKYNKARFEQAVQFALTQTSNHKRFYDVVREEFRKAGVIFVILPNLSGSKTNGATKRVNEHVMLMVNDRRLSADSFWFTLFHEIGHIMANDFGVSAEGDSGAKEEAADAYARDALIDPAAYADFVARNVFTPSAIRRFAREINRDPGIVVGRLQKDEHVSYRNSALNEMKKRYKVMVG
ncbi:HigA family addiction module antitoxin [[Collinsella] massiliensis]|uniref:Addiction module antidote protein, HigA family n=1 Tax=[Collinsella] massiliensis TaxID=1232426 RepID=A0A1Y3XLY2_9ACTN|nr:HigA family addiction module antitoxin [[Collinsella] massiliensis]OUN86221.1 addiction module antidote protein, HigA family [[Collinsella] massiliensis]